MTDNLDKVEPGVLSRWSRRKAQQSSVLANGNSSDTSIDGDKQSIGSSDVANPAGVDTPAILNSMDVGAADLPDLVIDAVDTAGVNSSATQHTAIADGTGSDQEQFSDVGDEHAEPILTDEDMPEIGSLSASSDVSMFFNEGVSKALRKAALAHIFKLPVYNIRDGLNDYDEDYTVFEPLGDTITCDMKFHARRRERERLEREKLEQEQLEQQYAEENLEQQPEQTEEQTEEQLETEDAKKVDDNQMIDNADPVDDPQQIEDRLHDNHALLADNEFSEPVSESRISASTPNVSGIQGSKDSAETVDVSTVDRPHVTHKESV